MTTDARPVAPLAYNLWRSLRPAQWTKNAIVFAALLFALGDRTLGATLAPALLLHAAAAAALFCLVSSGVYLLNDLWDLEADRFHPVKRFRPLAAGLVPLPLARVTALVLLAAGVALGSLLGRPVMLVLAAYILLQGVYTLFLKKVALVDIMVIAAGFVLRAVAGALAVRVPISPWLLLCTYLLALFLALCKRRHEKILLDDENADRHREALDRYHPVLMDQLIAIVAACAILAYSVYTLWPETVAKFHSQSLGFTIPFVIFGIFRYLDLVYRHGKGGRPEKLLLTDLPLLACVALFALAVLAVIALR